MSQSSFSEEHTTPGDKKKQLRRRHGSSDSPTENGSRRSSRSSTKSNSKPKTQRKKSFVNFAPLNTPLQNRLETMGVIWHCLSIPFFVSLFLLAISLGWIIWIFIILPYFIWWYWFDFHTPTNGKIVYRVKDWMKNIIIWEWFVNYFPITVHKACELEPTFTQMLVDDHEGNDDEEDLISEDSRTLIDKLFKRLGLRKRLNDTDSHNILDTTSSDKKSGKSLKYKKVSTGPRYIFGYHPHGVISMGVMGAFATNVIRNEPFQPPFRFLKPFFHDPSKYTRLLPGVGNTFLLTLTTQFTLPFYRDYLMGLGLTSASYKNIKSLINNGDNSVCLVVGGAQESLLNNMVSPRSRIGIGYKNDESDQSENDETEPIVKEYNPNEVQHYSMKKQLVKDIEVEKESSESESNLDNEKGEKNLESQDISEEHPGSETVYNQSDNERPNENFDGHNGTEAEKSDQVEESSSLDKESAGPRQIQLVLNKRKGFVKLAIELGNVSLVPTFGFGEADIFRISNPKPGSLGSKFQEWMKSTFQFTVPFFSARGVFIYDFGFLPFRNPIDICMGEPIYVPSGLIADYKLKHPGFDSDDEESEQKDTREKGDKDAGKKGNGTDSKKKNKKDSKKREKKVKIPSEILNHYHKLYVDGLKKVYEENKSKFGYEDVELIIIE
ncbi:uncharacterized protein AC631_02867 [Debaryomyces fabryi]|uniref:diacylglycerol O-acyltransferase n=1 Tax=Debaryomyces fabryi TaxID=58627 RepID=A0A0V1PZ28_9ASCO|nr:uncharacterized protein AC631_02867 [Debaryomyces fabryi]KSA01372.1 hypothetical protein AC631_02867 [Debaryomyces fabryi]CUM55654.1 unnamed protein product [Debaryomyces fabryi]